MRGYQKRIIYLKHTGSHLFDEAYFIVSPNGEKTRDADMVEEANRIIEDSIGSKGVRKGSSVLGFLYPFLIGVTSALVIFSTVLFIAWVL